MAYDVARWSCLSLVVTVSFGQMELSVFHLVVTVSLGQMCSQMELFVLSTVSFGQMCSHTDGVVCLEYYEFWPMM